MKRLARPRRSLWLVLGLLIAGLATAATIAVAGLQPADLTFTPKSESQMTNIDVARAYAKNYYGAPTAIAGTGATATWNTPLNLQSNYANEARSVADKGENWLAARSNVPNRAIVLDVDDTTLTTWNYELYSNWDFNPTTNQIFVGPHAGGSCPRSSDVHGEHVPGDAGNAGPGERGERSRVQDLLDHRARRHPASGDGRQPPERHRRRIL
jgi:hypothetical protein